ncbi:MAG: DUF2147 domain-containing protein [Hyphomicrobium sp.]
MRIGLALVAAATMGLLSNGAMAQTAEDAFGFWQEPTTGGQLEVLKCGEALCAKIAKVPPGKEDAKDVNNEDPAKRDRPLIGMMIMENAAKKDDTTWAGIIYDRERGKSFDATVKAKDKNTLEITGCKLAVLCRTKTLTRAQ